MQVRSARYRNWKNHEPRRRELTRKVFMSNKINKFLEVMYSLQCLVEMSIWCISTVDTNEEFFLGHLSIAPLRSLCLQISCMPLIDINRSPFLVSYPIGKED